MYQLPFFLSAFSLLILSCETQRTYYDAAGNEIDPPSESAKNSSLEERFTNTFTMTKNEQGIPTATSKKVSAFQSRLDAARKGEANSIERKSYDGVKAFDRSMRGDEWAKKQLERKKFDSTSQAAFSREMTPDFLQEGRGLIAREQSPLSSSRSSYEGHETSMPRQNHERVRGDYSTADTSGYFAKRREESQAPRVINRDEYIRMTLEESRALMGREGDE